MLIRKVQEELTGGHAKR